MRYTMMQVCKETGMTYQALKFYCNEGLVPNVKRDKNNRRVFDERDVAWISSLTRLKKCGMSIQEMKDYLAPLPARRAHHPAAKDPAGAEAGGTARRHSGIAGQRRLHRLKAEFLRRSALRQAAV